MNKSDIKKGLSEKTMADARALAEKMEVTGCVEDGILTIRVPLNVYKNERGTLVLGSSFGRFTKVAGAVNEDKDVLINFNLVRAR